ncbi:unnamed protein product [Ambrosiozyma monospora]|uniref:Unnamed protein product n=1 Tax=Ambrosiozyma monospora TaxID=43982 RepID=A0ACB5UAV6_AMBMO|nr:unnamed protein product [Ambrosiozyma monospora]
MLFQTNQMTTYDYSGGGGGGGSTYGVNDINALFQSLNSGISNNSDFMQGQAPMMQQQELQQQFGAIGSTLNDSVSNGGVGSTAPVSQFQLQQQMQQLQASFPGYQQQHQQQGQHQQQDFTNGYY